MLRDVRSPRSLDGGVFQVQQNRVVQSVPESMDSRLGENVGYSTTLHSTLSRIQTQPTEEIHVTDKTGQDVHDTSYV